MLRITRDRIVYSLDKAHPPVAVIDPGAEVLFETWDARTGTIRSERDLLDKPHPNGPNPATGPVFVRGAEPGDALVVHILDIALAEPGLYRDAAGPRRPWAHVSRSTGRSSSKLWTAWSSSTTGSASRCGPWSA